MFFLVLLSIFVASTAAVKDSRCVQYTAGAQAMTLPHRTDCTKFYICDAEGNALEMQCPAKLYYSAAEGVCAFDSSACTGGENIANEMPENETPQVIDNGFKNEQQFLEMACLDQPSGIKLPLIDDCFSYVICLQKKPIILTCPEGLAYDHKNSKCEFKEATDCKPYEIPMPVKPHEEAVADWQNTQPIWNVPDLPQHKPVPEAPIVSIPMLPDNPAQPILPMPQVPVVPQEEIPVQLPQIPEQKPEPVMPQEQEFMPYTPVTYLDPRCGQRFDPNNPVLLPHSRDCTKYLVCIGRNAVEKQCPMGQHWSVENSWCDFPQRAKCGTM